MKNIENRPVGCPYCGSMVQGRESSTPTHNGILHECQWNCPKCGQVARHEEELEEIDETSE